MLHVTLSCVAVAEYSICAIVGDIWRTADCSGANERVNIIVYRDIGDVGHE